MGTLNVLTGRKVLGTCIPSAPAESRIQSSHPERALLSLSLSLSLSFSTFLFPFFLTFFSATSLAREKRRAPRRRDEEETGGCCDVVARERLTSWCGCVLHASLVQESRKGSPWFAIRGIWREKSSVIWVQPRSEPARPSWSTIRICSVSKSSPLFLLSCPNRTVV